MQFDVPEPTPPEPQHLHLVANLPGYRIRPETAKVGNTYLFFSGGQLRGIGPVTRIMTFPNEDPDGRTRIMVAYTNVQNGNNLRAFGTVYAQDGTLINNFNLMYTVRPPANQLGQNQANYRRMLVRGMGKNAAVNKLVRNAPNAAIQRRGPLLSLRQELRPWESATGGSRKNNRSRRKTHKRN
jgi:hypothetical protein